MERRRTHDSSKDPTNHLCYFSLNGSCGKILLKPAKLKSSWGFSLWLARSQTSNAHFIGTRVGIVVARTIRRLLVSELEDSNLVVAMRSTPVARRQADAAAGDAPTVTRHAVEHREVTVVLGSSGALLQAGSGEGVSAPSNPVPNLPQPSSAAVESSHHPNGNELTVLDLVVTCLWRWHKLWNRQRNHTLQWRSTMRVSFQRDREGDLRRTGGSEYTVGCPGCDGTQLQTFAEVSTENELNWGSRHQAVYVTCEVMSSWKRRHRLFHLLNRLPC